MPKSTGVGLPQKKTQERKITGNLITSFASSFSTDLCECHQGREASSLQKHDWRYVPVCERRRFLRADAGKQQLG